MSEDTQKKLTAKQAVFADEYLIDLNATQAAIRAGYSEKTAEAAGSRLLTNVKVAQIIEIAMAERSQRTKITQDRVLKEYGRIAFVDPRKFFDDTGKLIAIGDLDEDTARALGGMDYHAEWETNKDSKDELKETMGSTTKIKLIDKKGALDSLGKHLGMFIDRKEIKEVTKFSTMDDDELDNFIEREEREYRDSTGGTVN